MLENAKDKPLCGESLSRWQSRTASGMQACLAGQALLFRHNRVWIVTPTPPREAETSRFRLLFIFLRRFPYNRCLCD